MRKLATITTSATTGFRVGEVIPVRSSKDERDPDDFPTELTLMLRGDFAGATLDIETGPTADGPWKADSDNSYTDEATVVTSMAMSAYFRVNPSSAGSSTNVGLWAG